MVMFKGGNTLLDPGIIITKSRINEGMTVADLGCGSTGHFVFPLSRIVGPSGKVYAIDIMKPSLENIKQRIRRENLQNIEAVWTNLEKFNATPIEASSLDRALLINTLYQSRKRVEIISEVIRMLKKNGLIIIVEWKNSAIPFGPPAHERVLEKALKETAPRLGLEVREEFFAGHYHYGLIFEKL